MNTHIRSRTFYDEPLGSGSLVQNLSRWFKIRAELLEHQAKDESGEEKNSLHMQSVMQLNENDLSGDEDIRKAVESIRNHLRLVRHERAFNNKDKCYRDIHYRNSLFKTITGHHRPTGSPRFAHIRKMFGLDDHAVQRTHESASVERQTSAHHKRKEETHKYKSEHDTKESAARERKERAERKKREETRAAAKERKDEEKEETTTGGKRRKDDEKREEEGRKDDEQRKESITAAEEGRKDDEQRKESITAAKGRKDDEQRKESITAAEGRIDDEQRKETKGRKDDEKKEETTTEAAEGRIDKEAKEQQKITEVQESTDTKVMTHRDAKAEPKKEEQTRWNKEGRTDTDPRTANHEVRPDEPLEQTKKSANELEEVTRRNRDTADKDMEKQTKVIEDMPANALPPPTFPSSLTQANMNPDQEKKFQTLLKKMKTAKSIISDALIDERSRTALENFMNALMRSVNDVFEKQTPPGDSPQTLRAAAQQ